MDNWTNGLTVNAAGRKRGQLLTAESCQQAVQGAMIGATARLTRWLPGALPHHDSKGTCTLMTVSKYRVSRRRRQIPWWWLGPYVIVIVIYLPVVLVLLHEGQDPVFALGVPATVSAVAVAVVERLGKVAGFARPAAIGAPRRRQV